MNSFANFGLSKTLEKSILNMGFISPTSVQEKSIPFALEGRDLLGSAQTGTGKTGAFAIPLIQKLMRDEVSVSYTHLRAHETRGNLVWPRVG